MKKDLQQVQQYILFLMVIQQPPLRAQNFELEILEKLEAPQEASKNGIVFEADKVILQYSKYKTRA